ncbi:unnamed protein product [Pleuronectes platessa]|uniref:Dynein light chain n=1 Tax=Pleuronectes platessa TaxID=8262 RepID=A0A9N7TN93_PLEPL|nr:unnamed protein product [Pleuronectes platessa]
MELCVTACEKFATNNESAAKMIKESLDKKFGSSWHVVIGEGFGFEVTHETRGIFLQLNGSEPNHTRPGPPFLPVKLFVIIQNNITAPSDTSNVIVFMVMPV